MITTGADTLGHQAEAIKAGDLLWISGTLAGDRGGLRSAPSSASQVDYILERFSAICAAGGSGLENLLRLRAYVTNPTDGYLVYSALRNAVPRDPPWVK